MINFNLIDIVENEIVGEGYYRKTYDGIFIKAVDNNVLRKFIKVIRDKKEIKGIHFKGLEADGAFRGPFMVTNIEGNDIYLKRI